MFNTLRSAIRLGAVSAFAVCAIPAAGPAGLQPSRGPAGQDPPATQASQPPAQSPLRPDQDALRAANRLTEPGARLAALRKLLTDFPETQLKAQIDSAVLTILTTSFPDRVGEIGAQLDTVLSSVEAAAAPHERLLRVQGAVNQLPDRIQDKPLLDRAAGLLREALDALDSGTYMDAQRALAASNKQPEPSQPAMERDLAQIRARASQVLGRLHLARGDAAGAEQQFRAALGANPGLAMSAFSLAKLEEKRGNDQSALAYYLHGAATGRGRTADYEALDRLFRRVHGTTASLDSMLDKVHREKFPSPVKPSPYMAPATPTGRLVLFELFTGSACPPCVSADLALDGVLARYPSHAVAALAYHLHVPQPDPMVVSGSVERNRYYKVSGVPTLIVDGARHGAGGGDVERAPATYDAYVGHVDKALDAPPGAAISVVAATDGRTVRATARVSDVKQGDAPRLHLVLAEKELRFSGENGIRFHPMVVRAVAGDQSGGMAVARGVETVIEHEFDLAAIAADVRRTVADEIASRRKSAPGGTAARDYRAENNALTRIDPRALVVVAFVQTADQQVLQAARAPVRWQGTDASGR